MKSKIKITLGIVIIILVSLVFIFTLYNRKNPKEKNIFDEMYYGEKKVYNRGANTPFSNIPGIEQWNRNDFMVNPSVKELSDRNNTVYERYEENYKTKKLGEWDIGFKFIYDEKRMVMGFNSKIVKEKLEIGLAYGYDEEKKRFREGINIYDKELPRGETRIIEIQKVKEYLKKYNISIKDLKETADELLFEKVIGDWEKYTNSRYSKDNLGTVKIERSPLFDGVD